MGVEEGDRPDPVIPYCRDPVERVCSLLWVIAVLTAAHMGLGIFAVLAGLF
jgi:hypothetical protein